MTRNNKTEQVKSLTVFYNNLVGISKLCYFIYKTLFRGSYIARGNQVSVKVMQQLHNIYNIGFLFP
jgi:hypothetical protein